MSSRQLYDTIRKGANIDLLPKGNHTHTLVFLHGLGDSADGFLGLFNDRAMSPTPPTMKVVLPTAPIREVTINMGMKMPSWYDKRGHDLSDQEFEKTIAVDHANQQAKRIVDILNNEVQLLKGESKKVFLGGFSQGAAMTMLAGLTYDKTLGGLLVFSGYHFPTLVEHENNANTPILISHGAIDPVLPWPESKMTYGKIDYKTHSVQEEVIDDLEHSLNEYSLHLFKQFLKKNIV